MLTTIDRVQRSTRDDAAANWDDATTNRNDATADRDDGYKYGRWHDAPDDGIQWADGVHGAAAKPLWTGI